MLNLSKKLYLPTGRDMVAIHGEGFFQEEIRCDFLVKEKMKKTWAVLMDLYLEFADICERHGLKYCAYAGTILGAVRHQGFIPWDDDMDVCMPRKDYDKFIEVASHELTEPYFLQTPFTEKGYFRTISRLSNIKTTRITQFYKHSGLSQGINLDIFPLDNCIPETIEEEISEILVSAKKCSQYMKRNDTNIMTPEHFASWKEYMTNNPMKEWQNVQDVAMRENCIETDYINMKVLVLPGSKYNLPLEKKWFDSVIKAKFEKIEVLIPSGFDSLLKTYYGDYMQYPPVEKRGTWHYGLTIDPEKPYTLYLD